MGKRTLEHLISNYPSSRPSRECYSPNPAIMFSVEADMRTIKVSRAKIVFPQPAKSTLTTKCSC